MNRFPVFVARWMEGDLDGGLAVLDEMERREPGLPFVAVFRPHVLTWLGRIAEACDGIDAFLNKNAEHPFAPILKAFAHALRHEREPLLAIVTGPAHELLWTDAELPEWVAGWLALVGEREQALEWLEHWVDRGSFNYPLLAHGDPLLENLREEPRFRQLLDRVHRLWVEFVPRLQPSGAMRSDSR
jgi:hypothetical protein